MIRRLRNIAVAILLGFNRVIRVFDPRQGGGQEHVEPEKQSDDYEKLLARYLSGTEEEQREAEHLLLSPESKGERDELFLRPFRSVNRARAPRSQRGARFGEVDIDELREQSERNAREQSERSSLERPIPYHELIQ